MANPVASQSDVSLMLAEMPREKLEQLALHLLADRVRPPAMVALSQATQSLESCTRIYKTSVEDRGEDGAVLRVRYHLHFDHGGPFADTVYGYKTEKECQADYEIASEALVKYIAFFKKSG